MLVLSTMTEFANPRYEMTPQGLRKRLEDLGLEYTAYIRPSITSKGAVTLALDSTTGERIIVEKSMEGAQPKGHFFQDLLMTVHSGSNPNFGAQQVDFSFNQHGDGELRKRVISGKENSTERIPEGASAEGILRLSQLALHHAIEFRENIKLEEEMGVNNQPATSDEIAEAMGYLNGATVLDQNYRPVATVNGN